MSRTPMLILGGLTLLVGAGGLLIGGMLFSSKRQIARIERFAEVHGSGTSIRSLVDDPLLGDTSRIAVDGEALVALPGKRPTPATSATLRDRVGRPGSGVLSLEWVYLPPFGRYLLDVDFKDGVISASRTKVLD
jgi:hypothetical protein